VLSVVGTLVVAHGSLGINGAMWEQISGAVLMLAPIVWSMYVHTDGQKIAAVTAMPGVAQIIVKTSADDGAAAAAADPTQPKVISAALAPAIAPKAAAALVVILALGSLFMPTIGHTQVPKPRDAFGVPGGIINSPRTTIANAIEAKQTEDITKFLTDLADISGAITLSTQIPGLQDPVGNACWLQFNGIGELLKVHPLPLNLKLASDIEAFRLLAIGMNQICANPNCGQMFLDATNTVNALAPVPLGISLASICAKVPVIGTSAVPTAAAPTAGIGTVAAPPALPAKP
jgi:hypothetical protein